MSVKAICIFQPDRPGQVIRNRPVCVVGESRNRPDHAFLQSAVAAMSGISHLPGSRYRRRRVSRGARCYWRAVDNRNTLGLAVIAQPPGAIVWQHTEEREFSVLVICCGHQTTFPGYLSAWCRPFALNKGQAAAHLFCDLYLYCCLRRRYQYRHHSGDEHRANYPFHALPLSLVSAEAAKRRSRTAFPVSCAHLASEIGPRFYSRLRYRELSRVRGDLLIPPGNQLESLKDDREGQYSIRINKQWRVCFKWSDGDAFEVEIADYH